MSKPEGIHEGIEASDSLYASEETSNEIKQESAFQRVCRSLAAPFAPVTAGINRLTSRIPRTLRTQLISLLALVVLGGVVGFSLDAAKNQVSVSDGEKVTAFATLENDTDKLLSQAGVNLTLDDEIMRTEANGGKRISIEVMRAFNVRVVADGKTQSLKMAGGDVGDALAAAGVEAGEQDILSASINSDLTEDMEIILQRVLTKMVQSEEVVYYKTEKKYTDSIYKGETKVSQEGKNGSKTVVTRQTIVNGKVTDSEVVSEEVTKKAVNKIVLVGTKEKPSKTTTNKTTTTKKDSGSSTNKNTNNNDNNDSGSSGSKTFVDSKGKTVKYKKLLTGSGTAYTEPKGGLTSTGRLAQYGIVAVDPRVIPYNTRLYIESVDGKYVYGYCIAGDTGSALRNGSALVDLYYSTESQCIKFGRRKVRVYIL